MPKAVLITQCLQTDFVGLVGAHDPLPNQSARGYGSAPRIAALSDGGGSGGTEDHE